jgi:hypothetical protein
MDLKIPYAKVSDAQSAYDLVKNHLPGTLSHLKVSADINYDDTSKKISASGKGFTMKVDFSPSDVNINIDLSFLLKPLKGKIAETIEKQFKRIV